MFPHINEANDDGLHSQTSLFSHLATQNEGRMKTHDGSRRPCDGPSNAVCVPVDVPVIPERALVNGLLAIALASLHHGVCIAFSFSEVLGGAWLRPLNLAGGESRGKNSREVGAVGAEGGVRRKIVQRDEREEVGRGRISLRRCGRPLERRWPVL